MNSEIFIIIRKKTREGKADEKDRDVFPGCNVRKKAEAFISKTELKP